MAILTSSIIINMGIGFAAYCQTGNWSPPLVGPVIAEDHETACKLGVADDMRLKQRLEVVHISLAPPTASFRKEFPLEDFDNQLLVAALTRIVDETVSYVYFCATTKDPQGRLRRVNKFLYRQAHRKKE